MGGKQIEQCIYSGEKHVYILIYEHTKKGIYESITYEDWELWQIFFVFYKRNMYYL